MTYRAVSLLPLALCVLACDPMLDSEDRAEDTELRTLALLSAAPTTAEFALELPPVVVSSYSLSEAGLGVLEDAGMLALVADAGSAPAATVVVRFDGVTVPSRHFAPGTITLRRNGQAAETPVAATRFSISIDGVGHATTEIVFAESEPESADFLVWQETVASAPPVALEPVQGVQYELVATDGTTTTCQAALTATAQLALGYTRIDAASGAIDVDIAGNCVAVLQAAVQQKPSEAFFVRCDQTTTTAVVGLHKVGDITLKRGLLHATGAPVADIVAQ